MSLPAHIEALLLRRSDPGVRAVLLDYTEESGRRLQVELHNNNNNNYYNNYYNNNNNNYIYNNNNNNNNYI